jgi:ubiquitin-like modifier-activating enzyme ATG7
VEELSGLKEVCESHRVMTKSPAFEILTNDHQVQEKAEAALADVEWDEASDNDEIEML